MENKKRWRAHLKRVVLLTLNPPKAGILPIGTKTDAIITGHKPSFALNGLA
jgi:hypothetical protein